MILKLSDWQRIRENFSEDEKAEINAALSGKVICPRAVILDEEQLGAVLLGKIKTKLIPDSCSLTTASGASL